jgi:cellulose synthase/poly-beta-1,6-N-acetylglucosamine synthase-like glycosyltransferase
MDRAIHQPVHPQTKKPLVTSQPIRGVYFSASKSNLKEIIVVDKENGGKADALNAGLTVSRYPLVCTIDADSVLDDDGLLKVVKPFLEKPDLMVAQGGIVRLANGCRLENGKIAGIGLPRKALPMFQVVEYVRAFVGSRLGQSELNSLLIISGVFALFKREAVLEVGGFDRSSIVEDMDLIVRLHRRQRELKRPYRIGYVPEPIAWTEGPETLRDLGKQRFRWQRGLLQTLWRHRDMFLNPRFGVIGLFAYPYYVVFEALGPVIEAIGYILIPSFFVLGMLNLQSFLVFFLLAFLAGSLLSVISLFLLEFSVRKYPRFGDAVRLVVFAFLESFGYRQLTLLWRLKALFAGPLSRSAWGHPRRTGFGTKAAPPSRG